MPLHYVREQKCVCAVWLPLQAGQATTAPLISCALQHNPPSVAQRNLVGAHENPAKTITTRQEAACVDLALKAQGLASEVNNNRSHVKFHVKFLHVLERQQDQHLALLLNVHNRARRRFRRKPDSQCVVSRGCG